MVFFHSGIRFIPKLLAGSFRGLPGRLSDVDPARSLPPGLPRAVGVIPSSEVLMRDESLLGKILIPYKPKYILRKLK